MNISRCNGHFTELICKGNYFFVYINQILFGVYTPIRIFLILAFFCLNILIASGSEHKRIISVWLNFKIIIKRSNFKQLFLRLLLKDCLIHLALLAGRADDKSVSVLFKSGFRDKRSVFKILDIA